MDFDNAIEKIVSRVKELSFGAVLKYDEVNKWLKLSISDDFMWAYDKLSDRLTIDHSICLEFKEDRVITAVPGDSDIRDAKKRNGFNPST